MAMEEKSVISKNDLIEIIEGFAKKNKIYSKEAQFQFDLAWEIRSLSSDYDVILEYLWKKEKWYIDIVVFSDEEKKCVPIEVKYKTAGKEIEYIVGNQKYCTFNQGAWDNGSYDYIKDIKRLELIGDILEYKGEPYKVENGFAIILTNDSHYYVEIPDKKEKTDSYGYNYYYWRNFSLAQKTIKGDLYWIDPVNGNIDESGDHTTEDRKERVSLTAQYSLRDKWKQYKVKYDSYSSKCKHNPEFKFLITQVFPEEREGDN